MDTRHTFVPISWLGPETKPVLFLQNTILLFITHKKGDLIK